MRRAHSASTSAVATRRGIVQTSFHVDTALCGVRSEPKANRIAREAVQQFARVLGHTQPHYWDPAAAMALGFRDVVAPPTYAFTLAFNPIPGLVLPRQGLIHSEQAFRYGVPIQAGDTIWVTAWLDDAKVRYPRGRLFAIVRIGTHGINQQREWVFDGVSGLIVQEMEGSP
jgi:acyl dehydratase